MNTNFSEKVKFSLKFLIEKWNKLSTESMYALQLLLLLLMNVIINYTAINRNTL